MVVNLHPCCLALRLVSGNELGSQSALHLAVSQQVVPAGRCTCRLPSDAGPGSASKVLASHLACLQLLALLAPVQRSAVEAALLQILRELQGQDIPPQPQVRIVCPAALNTAAVLLSGKPRCLCSCTDTRALCMRHKL